MELSMMQGGNNKLILGMTERAHMFDKYIYSISVDQEFKRFEAFTTVLVPFLLQCLGFCTGKLLILPETPVSVNVEGRSVALRPDISIVDVTKHLRLVVTEHKKASVVDPLAQLLASAVASMAVEGCSFSFYLITARFTVSESTFTVRPANSVCHIVSADEGQTVFNFANFADRQAIIEILDFMRQSIERKDNVTVDATRSAWKQKYMVLPPGAPSSSNAPSQAQAQGNISGANSPPRGGPSLAQSSSSNILQSSSNPTSAPEK
jgi:hypothetical protein